MSKVIFKTSDGDLLYRINVHNDEKQVKIWLQEFGAKGLDIASITHTALNKTRTLKQKNTYIANMCGKISHYATTQVYTPAVMPFVQRLKNRFGVFKCLYSPMCNFHTGCVGQTTLFRGAKSSQDIQYTISQGFIEEYVHSVKIHNVMASARTGMPVAKHNTLILKNLRQTFECEIQQSIDCDDCMFIHSFLFDKWSSKHELMFTLHSISFLRVNICRTGVINMFLSIRGGILLHEEAEHMYMPLFDKIVETIKEVV